MRRREFITLLGSAAAAPSFLWPIAARAQQPRKLWRIRFLAPAAPTPALLTAFREGLREHGYVEGQNLSIDLSLAVRAEYDVAAELARAEVDVIAAWGTQAVIAARRATATIPIVMVAGDPMAMGFVTNLARPGGNITGISIMAPDLGGKLVELLVEIVPGMKYIGAVRNPNNPGVTLLLRETEKAISALSLQLEVVEATAAEEFESAFAQLSTLGVKGVVLFPDPSIIEHENRIAEIAQKARLPTAFQRRENVEAGGLLSYGPHLTSLFRHAAVYVDRILKGAQPAELPVEQPTKFELVINLKTAKALGLEIPPTLLARADEVIE
jgi:putative tryptophan/tyrosine transport system substrate-binding protein